MRRLTALPLIVFVTLILTAATAGFAQVKVHTESIKPAVPTDAAAPATTPANPVTGSVPTNKLSAAAVGTQDSSPPEFDITQLPPPVARMREKILAAARSGDLNQLAAVMRANGAMPIFSPNEDKDPISFWKANYPDSDGVEVLSIVIEILDSGFVHADKGTPQDMYVWPYFARMPLKGLNPTQRVELFKIITGSDYKDMLDFGAYNFYRLGIAPDGSWQYFVAGD
jgi:hypothetical protein